MNKYVQCFRMGLQKALTYRGVEFIWVLSAFIAPLLFIALWRNSTPPVHSGFTLSEMITYYILITILSQFVTPHIDWDIANTIKRGDLNFFLTKPYRYVIKIFIEEFPSKFVNILFTLVPIIFLIFIFHNYISIPPLSISSLLIVIIILMSSYILLFLIQFCFGCMAFWFTEVWGMMRIFYVMNGIFAGRAFPLTLMPNILQKIGVVLPFQYFWYIPTLLLLGKTTVNENINNLFVMVLWIFIFILLSMFLWKKGLKSYSAFGG